MQALGSAPCIDALRLDVATVQKIVIEVISRVGTIPNVPSWKFTSQNASEVDISHLLQRYKYNANASTAETNAVVHVVLLELVIDRLLFLMQGVERHLASTLSSLSLESVAKDAKLLSSPLSSKYKSQIAAATQQFWMRVMSTTGALQTLNSKVSTDELANGQTVAETRRTAELREADTQTDDDNTVSGGRPKTALSCSCSVQTSELLQPVARDVAALCRTLGLASSCASRPPSAATNINDLKRTQAELVADLQLVSKAVKELQQRLTALQDCKRQAEEMRAELEHARCEINEQRHDYNKKLNDLSGKLQQTVKTKDDLQRQLKQQTQLAESHRVSLDKLNSLLQNGGQSAEIDLEVCVSGVVRELNELREQQLELQQQVCVEQVRCRSLQQQNSALIHKQQSLLTQYELLEIEKQTLTSELEKRICDTLSNQKRLESEEQQKSQQRISELESQLRESATQRSVESERSTQQIAAAQQQLQHAQDAVADLQEKLALLVQYPDSVDTDSLLLGRSSDRSASQNDVSSEMRRQIDANSLRINLLQRENDKLLRSVAKISQLSANSSSRHLDDLRISSAHNSHLTSSDTESRHLSVTSALRRDETELNTEAGQVGYRLSAMSAKQHQVDEEGDERAQTGTTTPVVQLWALPTPSGSNITSRQDTVSDTLGSLRTFPHDVGKPPRANDRTYRVSSAVALNRSNAPAQRATATADGAVRQHVVLDDVVIGPGKSARKPAHSAHSRQNSAKWL